MMQITCHFYLKFDGKVTLPEQHNLLDLIKQNIEINLDFRFGKLVH